MKLSEMDNLEPVIFEYIVENEVIWDLCNVQEIRPGIEDIREEYGNEFKLYTVKNENVKLDAKEMIKCYMEKIQKDIDEKIEGGYDVEEWIIRYFKEQEYNALDYILSNTFAKTECNIYPVKEEEIEIDI